MFSVSSSSSPTSFVTASIAGYSRAEESEEVDETLSIDSLCLNEPANKKQKAPSACGRFDGRLAGYTPSPLRGGEEGRIRMSAAADKELDEEFDIKWTRAVRAFLGEKLSREEARVESKSLCGQDSHVASGGEAMLCWNLGRPSGHRFGSAVYAPPPNKRRGAKGKKRGAETGKKPVSKEKKGGSELAMAPSTGPVAATDT